MYTFIEYIDYICQNRKFLIWDKRITNNLKHKIMNNKKGKERKEMKKKPQTDKIKVKSEYQKEKDHGGERATLIINKT